MNRIAIALVLITILILVVVLAVTLQSSGSSRTPAPDATTTPTPPPPPADAYTVGNYSTPYTDDGGGNTRFLDRQDVSCFANGGSGGGIQGFQLHQQAANSGKMQYNYSCVAGSAPASQASCRTASSTADDDGGGNLQYLDRQVVACNDGEELSEFHLTQPKGADKGSIQYNYTCCPSKKSVCREVTTKTDVSGYGTGPIPAGALGANFGKSKSNLRFLDRHNVVCNANESLKGFHFVQPGGPDSNTAAYTYTCCSEPTS
jgi:hypothetical protein